MNRLVVFGCSHTYGQGLSDCWDGGFHSGPQPSLLSWPGQLATLLKETYNPNMLLVNKSGPGQSNKEIMHNILLFNFQAGDICVIMWTYSARSSIFQGSGSKWDKNTTLQILPHFANKKSKKYYNNYYSDFDANYSMWQNINHAKLLLDSLDVPNWHCSVSKPLFLDAFPPRWNNAEIILTDFDKWMKETPALDNMHAGEPAHEKQAQELKVTIDAYYK